MPALVSRCGGVFKSTNGGESWTAINTGLTSTIDVICPGHRSFCTGHALRRHVRRRRLQEHQRRGELERHQHRPDSIPMSLPWPLILRRRPRSMPGPTIRRRLQEHQRRRELERHQRRPDQPQCLGPGDRSLGRRPRSTPALAAPRRLQEHQRRGTWTAINTGLTSTDVSALAIDPSNAGHALRRHAGGGVFKSTNAGGNWIAINSGPDQHRRATPWRSTLRRRPPSTPGTRTACGVFNRTEWRDLASSHERSLERRQRRLLHDERLGLEHRRRARFLHDEVPRQQPGRLGRPRTDLQPRVGQVGHLLRRPRVGLQRDLQLRSHPHHVGHPVSQHRLRDVHARLRRNPEPDHSGRLLVGPDSRRLLTLDPLHPRGRRLPLQSRPRQQRRTFPRRSTRLSSLPPARRSPRRATPFPRTE